MCQQLNSNAAAQARRGYGVEHETRTLSRRCLALPGSPFLVHRLKSQNKFLRGLRALRGKKKNDLTTERAENAEKLQRCPPVFDTV